MKKIYIAVLLALFLSACGNSQQRVDFKQALIAKLADDSDLKDYKLDPADIADCIVSGVSDNLPSTPKGHHKIEFFEAYAKFVSLNSPGEVQKTMEQYQELFGGIQETQAAALGLTDYIMDCMGQAIEKHTPDGQPVEKHTAEGEKPAESSVQENQPATETPAPSTK